MTAVPHPAKRVAVLIDADNVPADVLDQVMVEARARGAIVVACAYRHWTDETQKGWRAGSLKHGINLVEQAPGPNAADIALAMDAVDLLRDRGLDVVCVVSGDLDFAPLAARLRRSRVTAVLMSDPAKVKESNRALWDVFIPLVTASKKPAKAPAPAPAAKPVPTAAMPQPKVNGALLVAVLGRLADADVRKDGEGWARLTEVGRGIAAGLKKPSLRKALTGRAAIEIADRQFGGAGTEIACVRRRPANG